jgi:hypothetical protein
MGLVEDRHAIDMILDRLRQQRLSLVRPVETFRLLREELAAVADNFGNADLDEALALLGALHVDGEVLLRQADVAIDHLATYFAKLAGL